MMVLYPPIVAIFHIREAVARWKGFGLTVLHVGKRVIARVDCRVVMDPDNLITERDLELRESGESRHEIRPDRSMIGSQRWRQRSPEYGVIRIQRGDCVG